VQIAHGGHKNDLLAFGKGLAESGDGAMNLHVQALLARRSAIPTTAPICCR
jgi:hypothetical protein